MNRRSFLKFGTGGLVATATMAEAGMLEEFLSWLRRKPAWSIPERKPKISNYAALSIDRGVPPYLSYADYINLSDVAVSSLPSADVEEAADELARKMAWSIDMAIASGAPCL